MGIEYLGHTVTQIFNSHANVRLFCDFDVNPFLFPLSMRSFLVHQLEAKHGR